MSACAFWLGLALITLLVVLSELDWKRRRRK